MPASPMIARIGSDAYGHIPADYGELRQLAFRFGMEELADRTFINHATQLCIEVTPEALKAATRSGTPSDLLLALSALPFLLAQAEYRRTVEPSRRRTGIRHAQILTANAEVCGRGCKLLIAVREMRSGQCFFAGMKELNAVKRRRDAGGGTPDERDSSSDNDSSSDDASAITGSEPIQIADAAAARLSDRDKRYLDTYYDLVNEQAKKYFVDPTLVLGLGAESAFGMSPIFKKHKDAFGLSGGSLETQPDFASYEANVQRLFALYGRRFWGTGGDTTAFINALEGKDAAGMPVSGWKPYNTVDPKGWHKMAVEGVGQMRRSVPAYLAQRKSEQP